MGVALANMVSHYGGPDLPWWMMAAQVLFNRPQQHNAMNYAVYDALETVSSRLQDDSETRVVVFSGEGGRAFSAGNDIADLSGITNGDKGVEHDVLLRRVLGALTEITQVTVAAVDGICVGGGMAVATHCDIRMCTETSRFGYPIAATLGNALSKSMVYRCVDIFGESMTREMFLGAKLISASRAFSAGAVASVASSREVLLGEVEELTRSIRATAPTTTSVTKQQLRHLIRDAHSEDDAELLRQAYGSDDFREGVRAFTARERPIFGRTSMP